MLKEHPYVLCMMLDDLFGGALCLMLVVEVNFHGLSNRCCYPTCVMSLGVSVNFGDCEKSYLGHRLGCRDPHQANSFGRYILGQLIMVYMDCLHITLLLTLVDAS